MSRSSAHPSRRVLTLVVRFVAVVALLLVSGCRQHDSEPVRTPPSALVADSDSPFTEDGRLNVGRTLPAFQVATLAGDSVAVGDGANGTVTLVNLWDTTCGPCKVEFPALQRLLERHGPQGLHIVAISNDQNDAAVRAFIMQTGATFTIGRDPENLLLRRLRDRGVPQHALVSGDGTILWERMGAVSSDRPDTAMTRVIETALGTP